MVGIKSERQEKRLIQKSKKVLLKIIKFGAMLDKQGIPYRIEYKNSTQMKKENEKNERM